MDAFKVPWTFLAFIAGNFGYNNEWTHVTDDGKVIKAKKIILGDIYDTFIEFEISKGK